MGATTIEGITVSDSGAPALNLETSRIATGEALRRRWSPESDAPRDLRRLAELPTRFCQMKYTADLQTTELTYDDWNQAVGRCIFNNRNAGRSIRLAVDPLVLQRAAAESKRPHHFSTPDAAADDFIMAVRQRINSTKCWRLGGTFRGQVPRGLAKLALQVLAVFYISQDEIVGRSYWVALWELLGRQFGRPGAMPDDLDRKTHQDNWASLTEWANVINQGHLGLLPAPEDFDGQRHVKLPLGNGLLRLDDIRQLPRFFNRIPGVVTPGEYVEPDELIPYIRSDADNPAVFRGAHARRVLGDERLHLAAAQIANAVLQWDGCRVDLGTARGPVYRLWLDLRPQCGSLFRLRGGLRRVEPTGQQTDLRSFGLENVFGRAGMRSTGLAVPYRPIDDRVLLAIRSLLDGMYQEARQARPGDEVVFVRSATGDIGRFATLLGCVAVKKTVDWSDQASGGLPAGWVALRLRLREDLVEYEIPAELRNRIRVGGSRVRLFGGLRIRRAWMAGAGPALEVVGGAAGSVVVDGEEYDLSVRRLYPERCPKLNHAGMHEVWLPDWYRVAIRFRVIEPPLARFRSPLVGAGWRRAGCSRPGC
jgi:hypothetical protein